MRVCSDPLAQATLTIGAVWPNQSSPRVKFLRNHRHRILMPHKLLGGLTAHVRDVAELADALGRQLGDERWTAAANVLWKFYAELRALL